MFALFNAGWFALLIGLIIGAIQLIAWWVDRKKKRLTYAMDSVRLIGSETRPLTPGLSVFFKDVPIERLTRTTVFIWNDGKESILRSDLVDGDPLRVSCNQGPNRESIITAEIVKTSRDAAILEPVVLLNNEGTEVRISFAFLDHLDGIAIEIYHELDPTDLRLEGTVVGIPQGLRRRRSEREPPPWLLKFIRQFAGRVWFARIVLNGILITYAVWAGIVLYRLHTGQPSLMQLSQYSEIVSVTFALAFVCCLRWLLRKTIPRSIWVDDKRSQSERRPSR